MKAYFTRIFDAGTVIRISGKLNKLISRYRKNSDRFIFTLFTLLFFLTRLVNLGSIPILNDEGIYLHWGSQLFDPDPAIKFNFIAIDGKQTGVAIILGLAQLLPFDPLISGRMVFAILSVITFISILAVKRKLFPQTPLWSMALLLIFCPYLLYYDRTVLPDSLVAALFSLVFLVTVYNLENQSHKKSLITGAIIAAGWWFKSTILLAFPAILVLYFYDFIKRRHPVRKLIISFSESAVSFLIFVSPLLLSFAFRQSPDKGTGRLLGIGGDFGQYLRFWRMNIQSVTEWFLGYTTPLTAVSFIAAVFHGRKKNIHALLWFFVPLILVLFTLKGILSARWIVFLVPGYLLLVHEGIYTLSKYKNLFLSVTVGILIILSVILIFFPLTYYQLLQFSPKTRSDLGLTGWTSGYGVKEAAELIETLAQKKKSIVFLSGNSGNPEDGIYVYLKKIPNVRIMGDVNYRYLVKNQEKYRDLFQTTDFYYISRGDQFGELKSALIPVTKFRKPLDDEFVGLYKVKID